MKHTTTTTTLVALFLVIFLSGCNDDDNKPEGKYSNIYGIWDRTGYGDLLVINEKGADMYQFTRQTCFQEDSLDNIELETIIDKLEISNDKKTFSVIPPLTPAYRMYFEKLEELPMVCQADQIISTATATDTFEHLWHNFNDYYAFFNEHNVDWQQQYAIYQPLVTNDMTDSELWSVLTSMLGTMPDGHISLESEDDSFSAEPAPRLLMALQEAFSQQNDITDFQVFIEQQVTHMEQVQNSYVKNLKYGGGPDDEVAAWGRINDQLGYLRVTRMAAIDPDTDLADIETVSGADDAAAMQALMQTVVKDLQGVMAIIIDVRINGGGHDAVSLTIAEHFAQQYQLALQKHTRTWKGDSQMVEAYLQPSENRLIVPIAILSSDLTVSAAETFLMAMRSIPQVSIIGDNSQGILSDTLPKLLPNGWDMTLSNEVHYDYLGINYEVVGVPADIAVNPFDLEAYSDDRDIALEEAMLQLGFQP